MTFIINEDAALKEILKSVFVSDERNQQRPVGVWYGQPDPEIRQQSYPYITIDLVNVEEATERSHRGWINYEYHFEGTDATKNYSGEYPIPINLDYQVTTYARQPRHDRQLIGYLLNDALRLRFATIPVPEDQTVRRLDVLGFSKRDTTENGKRLFVNVFTVRVSSEILPGQILELNPITRRDIFVGFTDASLSQPTD